MQSRSAQGRRSTSDFKYYLYDNQRRTFVPIKNGSICGRFEGELKFPSDDLISRRHCQFTIIGNEVYIEDFGSTNCTKVNAAGIHPMRKRRVRLNDVIEIGQQRFVLTAQNKYPPGHVEKPFGGVVFKGVKKTDGSLGVQGTGMFTQQTLVRMDRNSFVKLRLKRDVRKMAGRCSSGWVGGLAFVIGFYAAPGVWLLGMTAAMVAGLWHHFGVKRLVDSRGSRLLVTGLSLAVISGVSMFEARQLKSHSRSPSSAVPSSRQAAEISCQEVDADDPVCRVILHRSTSVLAPRRARLPEP